MDRSAEAMRADFSRAGIEHQDGAGRIAHFHSFRKSFQTLGVNAGVNQRSAQALLGHSDPSLTAGPYTDVASLETARRSRKAAVVWCKSGVVIRIQITSKETVNRSLTEVLSDLINLAQTAIK